jgi:hypothetical protein
MPTPNFHSRTMQSLWLITITRMSFEGHPVLILPNDKRRPARPGQARCYHARACLEIAGFSANDVENCFAGLVEEGLLEHDDDNNLVFTGLSTSGRDTVGAIRNQEFPDETKSNAD